MKPPEIYLSREAQRLGTDRELRRRAERGELKRLLPGAYVSSDEWLSMSEREQYITKVQAAARISSPDSQFSHDSAAALWGLPVLGRWPSRVHQLTERSTGGTSRVSIARHGLGVDPAPQLIDGVVVTSLTRTLIDLAASRQFAAGVVTVDAGLRTPEPGDTRHSLDVPTPSRDEMLSALEALMPYPCAARAKKVIRFSSPLSGSVAESLARVQFHALGIPAPELQVPFYDEEGLIGAVDFYWPELDLIGEVDGRVKYGANRRYRLDVSAESVLWEEKEREDRLRRVVASLMRLDWKKITNRAALRAYLASFGLHPGR